MVLIKLALCFLILALAVGAFVSIFIFAVDVVRWHDKEKKTIIVPSNSSDNIDESEVNNNASESGEYNTSTFSFPRGES